LNMQYVTARDGVRIAFGTAGDGPTLVRVPSLPFSHSQREWENGSEFYERLAEKWRIVQFDPRGTGLSERNIDDFSLETRLLDIEAVLDKLGTGPVALHGMGWSGPLVVTYAVRHPERVSHLILDDSMARTEDFMNLPQIRALDQLTGQWDLFLEYVAYMIYGYGREEAAPVVEHLRACVSPEGAQLIFDQARGDDVSDLLPLVTQPTLVVQHEEMNQQAEEAARELAALIPNARLVMIAGQAADDTGRIIHAIADLLGTEHAEHHAPPPSSPAPAIASGVRTILFTDLVSHTEMMSRLGDEKGRAVLREHEDLTRRQLVEFGGDEVKSMGDGFMASFGSVSKAVECAIAMQRAFARHNETDEEPLSVRVGLNVGEPIEDGGDLFGATVIMAARIAAKAEGGEILVANAVRELSAGKGFLFADRGDFVAKGFEEPVRVYEVRWRD
ncbi:MAG: adenylate/guanylate cyclase domain-containing protein, partial [Chloroflexi bacterium]|nr:adenylate/guanylate cyclase domain-containing protein [Chloroflexota bacterium]